MKRLLLILGVVMSVSVCGSCAQREASGQTQDATEQATQDPQTVNRTPQDNLPTVYDFSATWCGPCKVFAPIFKKVAAEYGSKVNFVTVDVDRQPQMAQYYGIRSVPTVVVVDTSNVVLGGRMGLMDEAEFKAFLKATLDL